MPGNDRANTRNEQKDQKRSHLPSLLGGARLRRLRFQERRDGSSRRPRPGAGARLRIPRPLDPDRHRERAGGRRDAAAAHGRARWQHASPPPGRHRRSLELFRQFPRVRARHTALADAPRHRPDPHLSGNAALLTPDSERRREVTLRHRRALHPPTRPAVIPGKRADLSRQTNCFSQAGFPWSRNNPSRKGGSQCDTDRELLFPRLSSSAFLILAHLLWSLCSRRSQRRRRRCASGSPSRSWPRRRRTTSPWCRSRPRPSSEEPIRGQRATPPDLRPSGRFGRCPAWARRAAPACLRGCMWGRPRPRWRSRPEGRRSWSRSRPRIASPVSKPDRKSTRLNSSHGSISYAVFCLKKKKNKNINFYFINKKKKLCKYNYN